MIRRQVILRNKLGLHARAASKLVRTATGFDCQVWVQRDQRRVNAKSIMGVLMLAAPCGTTLEIECDGLDEASALEAIEALVEQRFGED